MSTLDKTSLLFPMVALATLTFAVLLLIPLRRFRAGFAGKVRIAYLAIGRVNESALTLAWLYVGLRIAHSAIHVTYNRVRHRLVAFALSNVVLVMFWTNLVRAF